MENNQEIWKVIPKYPNYEISNFGNIRNINGKIRKICNNGNGYKRITIVVNGKHTTLYIHRSVLESFCPIENSENLEVHHKDFNRGNNILSNLEWIKHKENMQDSFRNGNFKNRDIKRSIEYKKLGDSGKHQWSKLNKTQIIEIYNLWNVKQFSYSKIAKIYGVTGPAIKHAILRYKNGRYN